MENQATWSKIESALQDANKLLRQILTEKMKLVAELETGIAKLEDKCGLKEQQVQALAEKCASKERQIMSLSQVIEEHQRNTTSTEKYEQTIAELKDKLGEYRALLATPTGSYSDPFFKLLPPPYYPPELPPISSGARRPMTTPGNV